MKSDGFNCQSHQGCSEKHSQSIFQGKRKFLIRSWKMILMMGKVMKHSAHQKLVKKYYHKDGEEFQKQSNLVVCIGAWTSWLFFFKSRDEVVGFGDEKEIETDSNYGNEKHWEEPWKDFAENNFFLGVVCVSPDDFTGLRSLLDSYLTFKVPEVLSHSLAVKFLRLTSFKHLWHENFSGESNDCDLTL